MNARLRVAVLGRGRVGTALAAALAARHHDVTPAYVAVTDEDVVFLCVPDDVLETVAASLVVPATTIVAHTSGRHGLGVLRGHARRGAWHPVMTFVGDPVLDVPRLRKATIGLTADDAARPVLDNLARSLAARSETIGDEERALYHAGLAHGANHLVTHVVQSAEILAAAGVEDPMSMLRPLLEAALDNVLRMGEAALTGPVIRGDGATVAAHLAALRGHPARASYAHLATETVKRATSDGRLDEAAASRVLTALTAASELPL